VRARVGPSELYSPIPYSVSVLEPASGVASLRVAISLGRPARNLVSVVYETVDGTATAASGDFGSRQAVLQFDVGQQLKYIYVPINADAVSEGPETFKIAVRGASTWTHFGATVGSHTTTVTISNTAQSTAAPAVPPANAQTPPGTPTSVTGNATASTTASVRWNGVAGASSYVVQYRRSGGTAATKSTTAKALTLSGLTDNSNYEVAVAAVNSAGASAYSSWVRLKTLPAWTATAAAGVSVVSVRTPSGGVFDLGHARPGQQGIVTVTVVNSSRGTAWSNAGPSPVRLSTLGSASRLAPDKGWLNPDRPAQLREGNVAPGALGHFDFPFVVPNQRAGMLSEQFTLVAETAAFFSATPRISLDMQVVPVVGAADVPGMDASWWAVASDGGVFTSGSAPFFGSMGGQVLNAPVVGMAATPSGRGYWLTAADGGVFTFGDAPFLGSMGGQVLNAPVVGMAATPSGRGYWLTAADGGVFTFGDAPFLGSMGGQVLNAPVVGMAATPSGRGYWLTAADGGVFTFGDAPFLGAATSSLKITPPTAGIVAGPAGQGYKLVRSDGSAQVFGDPYAGQDRVSVVNSSFEGDVSAWKVIGSRATRVLDTSGPAWDGVGSLLVSATDAGDSIYQDVALSQTTGGTEVAAVHLRGVDGTAAGDLCLWGLGLSAAEKACVYLEVDPKAWRTAEVVLNGVGPHDVLRVQFYPRPGAGRVRLDALGVRRDVLLTAGAANTTAGWRSSAGANFVNYHEAPNAHSGSGFFATNSATAGGSVLQDRSLDVTPSTAFELSGWFRGTANAAGGTLCVWGLGVTQSENACVNVTADTARYQQTVLTFRPSRAHNLLRVEFYPFVNGPTVFFDTLSLRRLSVGD
jgi:hypothetical protein